MIINVILPTHHKNAMINKLLYYLDLKYTIDDIDKIIQYKDATGTMLYEILMTDYTGYRFYKDTLNLDMRTFT